MKNNLMEEYLKKQKLLSKLYEKGLCQNCGKRKATENWVGEGSTMDFIHGFYQRWCKRCCLEAQIAYAEEHKNDIKKLKEELKKVRR